MKTSLFNPIFINPLAYFVFPQLYDITPELEVLIEPCVFTGTLMVQTSDNTVVRFYENTKSIDLTEFANSTVTISQYTDIGSTVLGQWKLAGKHKVEEVFPITFNELLPGATLISKSKIDLMLNGGYSIGDGSIAEGEIHTFPSYEIDVTGLTDGNAFFINKEDATGQTIILNVFENGRYTVPKVVYEFNENMPVWVLSYLATQNEGNVTISIVPITNKKQTLK